MKKSRFTDSQIMAKMKELEDENRRLKKMYVDAQMRAMIVEEALASGGRWPRSQ